MGQSTNAILFWGYTWPEEETSRPWEIGKDTDHDADEADDDSDWEGRYAALNGLPAPDNNDYSGQDWTDYWEEKRRLLAKSNCVVDTHCSGDCPMPYVAITASHAVAHRGYPNELSNNHMTVMPEWREQIDSFCQLMGIPIPQTEPRWFLVSDWWQETPPTHSNCADDSEQAVLWIDP